MIEHFLHLAGDPAAEGDLRDAVTRHAEALRDSAHRGERGLVRRAEVAVATFPPAVFTFDAAGNATLRVDGREWAAGRFETPSLAELRARARPGRGGRLWVFDGASPVTDIGGLQATADGRPLFQVASQFNCLESPGAYLVPVSQYFSDATQGPRASVSAFPATLLRHYAAPGLGGDRFTQTDGSQIDLLEDVFEPGRSPVHSGYLRGHGGMGADVLRAALEEGFERIRVGVHDDAQVVLGYDWDGAVPDSDTRRVGQVFTSTLAAGGYGAGGAFGDDFEPACRQLLRAAYLGTLLAASSLGRAPVVLTLIGGGVFGNPVEVIWDAIRWAFDQAREFLPGDVVVNGRDLTRRLDPEDVLADTRERGGAVLHFDYDGLVEVSRPSSL